MSTELKPVLGTETSPDPKGLGPAEAELRPLWSLFVCCHRGCLLRPGLLPLLSSWSHPGLLCLILTSLCLGSILLCPLWHLPLALSPGGLLGPLRPSTCRAVAAVAVTPSCTLSSQGCAGSRASFPGGLVVAGSFWGPGRPCATSLGLLSSLRMLCFITPGLLRCSRLGLEGREESSSGCCCAMSHPTLLLAPTHLHRLRLRLLGGCWLLLGGTCKEGMSPGRARQRELVHSTSRPFFTLLLCSCHRGLGSLGGSFLSWLSGLSALSACLAQLLLVPQFLVG